MIINLNKYFFFKFSLFFPIPFTCWDACKGVHVARNCAELLLLPPQHGIYTTTCPNLAQINPSKKKKKPKGFFKGAEKASYLDQNRFPCTRSIRSSSREVFLLVLLSSTRTLKSKKAAAKKNRKATRLHGLDATAGLVHRPQHISHRSSEQV